MIQDLCIIMLTAGITSLLFKAFKQPVVLGYIVAGMLVGPHVLGEAWVSNEENVETWGEIGVLFLLFSLGLEFSFKKLLKVGSTAIIGAGVIVVGMMIAGMLTAYFLGLGGLNSLFLGGMLCMSSTTIVFKAIEEAGLRSHRFAGVCFGILIVEDLFAVVLMVLLTSIAVKNEFQGKELLWQVGKLVMYIAIWFVLGILFIPTFLKKFKKHLNDETLTIFSIGLCLGMVLLAVQSGFSSALGAFVMGSVLAETIDAERIEHLVQPVKNIFGSIFFVSVGMMIDPALLLQYWFPISIITLVVIIGQILFGSFGTLLSGQPLRVALQTGFSLVQIGEFAFIIAALGQSLKVTDTSLYPIVVAVSVITTFLTPYIMKLAYPTLSFLEKHMSKSTQKMLDSYVEKRQSGTSTKKRKPSWIAQIDRLVKYLLLKIAMAPGINQLLRVFNENLYARERLAESQRGLEREVENSLISLEMNIAEVDVPSNSAFAGRALKDLNIRNITGANIVRIIRGGININIPGGNHRLYPGDRIILAGSDTDVAAFQKMLETSLAPTDDLDSVSTNIVLDNFTITADSPLCGKSIIKSGIREKGNCIVLGLVRPSEDFYTNPDPSLIIQEEDIIIVAGEEQKMHEFFAEAAISNPKIWS
ncbi:MAG: cation:proton antiporter [Bacteroidaceae bacterium]|nr:cation:proton antiporter [Bacteroidaceae bacterium]